MDKKPCYEDFVNELPVKCLEGTENEGKECLVLENGGCWDECGSGKLCEEYMTTKRIAKIKLAKAREIRENICEFLRLKGSLVDEYTGLKAQLTKIIKRRL